MNVTLWTQAISITWKFSVIQIKKTRYSESIDVDTNADAYADANANVNWESKGGLASWIKKDSIERQVIDKLVDKICCLRWTIGDEMQD